ncbi:NAD(+) hydrolase sarm1-like [Argiope bruennichi]|uniref:NAD(+) hydrolase sarm1-like n=1 Tax=Argiope bruennichi TaxID=94029 RepID=UPI0024950650|nr:NAD(+) hydrolase sarm1-like [Argiope bruennichi]
MYLDLCKKVCEKYVELGKSNLVWKALPFFIRPVLNLVIQSSKFVSRLQTNENEEQVLSWVVDDVAAWIEKNGFSWCKQAFIDSQVDGDLLLQLDEKSLMESIGMNNGILRKRFMRLLNHLKCYADYSLIDESGINDFLKRLEPEYCQYTYRMLLSGIRYEDIKYLTSEILEKECGISNSIHRAKILHKAKVESHLSNSAEAETSNRSETQDFDAFISYRRSSGSHLASLLYTYLKARGLSVYLDVDILKNGRFDLHILDSISRAKNFILVLTHDALDRCLNDDKCEDWVHKEIVEAVKNECNIIPVFDNFRWPAENALPEDIQLISLCNGVRWNHDFQEPTIDKIQEFMVDELSSWNELKFRQKASRSSECELEFSSEAISCFRHKHQTSRSMHCR